LDKLSHLLKFCYYKVRVSVKNIKIINHVQSGADIVDLTLGACHFIIGYNSSRLFDVENYY